MKRDLRLVDAVVIAAVALLGLKLIGAFGPSWREGEPSAAAPSTFARVLAHARTNYVPPEIIATGSVPDKKDAKPADGPKTAEASDAAKAPRPTALEPVAAPFSPTERALLERLGERRDELQQRARDADMRERLLENAERKLDQRLDELKALAEKADGTAVAAKRGEAEASGALRNLITMYETMKPKDAARVFDRLPHDVLVPVVLQMNPRKMAEVLAAMAPEAAEKLTIALATRARTAPGETKAASASALPGNELPAIDQAPAAR